METVGAIAGWPGALLDPESAEQSVNEWHAFQNGDKLSSIWKLDRVGGGLSRATGHGQYCASRKSQRIERAARWQLFQTNAKVAKKLEFHGATRPHRPDSQRSQEVTVPRASPRPVEKWLFAGAADLQRQSPSSAEPEQQVPANYPVGRRLWPIRLLVKPWSPSELLSDILATGSELDESGPTSQLQNGYR